MVMIGTVADAAKATIARIDTLLNEQINLILHHPEFQMLESAWRGLHHLISRSGTSTYLKIRVLDISRSELAHVLRRYKGTAWDQSPIYQHIHETEYGRRGGEPYGCLVADYYFDHSANDMEILREMARIAAAAHAPFVAGASPRVMQMGDWQELKNPRSLAKIFAIPEYLQWRTLRESEDSRYVCLTLPRFLARSPYGAKSLRVETFAFEEETVLGDHACCCWANSSYAMGASIGRAVSLYGWCARISGFESGGLVDNLPMFTFPSDDGGAATICPTEISVSDRRQVELSTVGFAALVHRKHTDVAAFVSAPSLRSPPEYSDPDKTYQSKLSVRLPYVLTGCRFVQYLECLARESDEWGEDLQERLQAWVDEYVDRNPGHSSDIVKTRRPLASAKIAVARAAGGVWFTVNITLQPHHQLQRSAETLKMEIRLPANGPA